MEQDTKQKIHDYLKDATKQYIESGKWIDDANTIADLFHISRSLVSKYESALFAENVLVRIASRPVYYFDYEVLKDAYDQFNETEFLSKDAFIAYFKDLKRKSSPFKDVVGEKDSLYDTILKLKMITKYANSESIVLLISGEQGTGKNFLIKKLVASLEVGEKNRTRMEVVDAVCFMKQNQDLKQYPVILIQNMEMLSVIEQRALMHIINANKEEKAERYSIVILSVNDMTRIDPIVAEYSSHHIMLPVLDERSIKERLELIYYQLLEEERIANKKIVISNYALNTLSHFHYTTNIDGLKETVKITCTNASFNQISERMIVIGLYHLPKAIFTQIDDMLKIEDKQLLTLNDIKKEIHSDRILQYCDDILVSFEKLQKNELNDKQFLRFCENKMNSCCDYMIFEKKTNGEQLFMIENILNNIMEIIENKYKLKLDTSSQLLLSRLIYKSAYLDTNLSKWEMKKRDLLHQLDIYLNHTYYQEYGLLKEIETMMVSVLDKSLDMITRFFLLLSIKNSGDLKSNHMLGLIIAHGYSTASSITDSCNRLIGNHIFEAIDMPLDINADEIVTHINEFIRLRGINRDIVLLVDMGSLEEIGPKIKRKPTVKIGVINNISTRVVLAAGYGIQEGLDVKGVLEKASEAAVCTYQIIENEEKQDAIILTSETGIAATEKIEELFRASIPKHIHFHLISYDYYSLLNNGINDIIFKNYNILFITGTLSPKIDEIPFISLEDIISFKDIRRINVLLSGRMSEEDIEQLNANLLKNFSLENVMQKITILNPVMLMEYIEESLNKLQRKFGFQFSNKTMIGLYIHISCLIERLVTKNPVTEYSDIKGFENENKAFIESINESFAELCQHYNIEIPLSEVAYLHTYMEDNSKTDYELAKQLNDE